MNIQMAGMVIFPVRYIVQDDYKQSYIIARDLQNKFVKIHILPNENMVKRAQQSTSHSIPMVSEFAKTGKKARNPCAADEKNSKNKPCGVLLCEQITKVQDSMHANYTFPTYHAKWASNLREDLAEPTPGIGVGFLEISYTYPKKNPNQSFASIKNMTASYIEKANSPIINPLDRDDLLTRDAEMIFNTRGKRYSSVIIKHREIQENLSISTPNQLRGMLESAVSKYTNNGRYGVALIRVRKGDVVDTDASTRFVMDYNYTEKRINTHDENWNRFRRYEAEKLFPFIKDGGYSIDIIPCQRIYFGPQGITKYDKELMPISGEGHINPPSKLIKQFVDKKYHTDPTYDLVVNHAFLASFIGVRVARIEDGSSQGNEIASTIHSYSKVVAPAIALRADLSSYKLKGDVNNIPQLNAA
jgi:hypothetical protein